MLQNSDKSETVGRSGDRALETGDREPKAVTQLRLGGM